MFFIQQFVDRLFLLLQILIIARIVSSWVSIPSNRFTDPIMSFIYDVTEPILGRVRSIMPPLMVGGMGIDLSPMIAILILYLVQSFVHMILRFFTF